MKDRSVLTAGQYTAEDYDKAMKEPVVLAAQATPRWRAPHFVWQVRRELGSILCGPDVGQDCEKIDTGGYKVITTLDWKMQQAAEKWSNAAGRGPVQKNPAAYYKSAKVPYRQWLKNLEGKGVNNAALASIDYRTGQVLAYTGSAGYYLPSKTKKFSPQFDVLADGWRQPGSAFKPINYITGIEDRTLTAASLFMDVTTDFGGGWTPTDADQMERGPLRLREALQVSLNIPSIKAAAYNGVDHVLQSARKFGIRFQPGVGSRALGRDRDDGDPHGRPRERLRCHRERRRPRPQDDDHQGHRPTRERHLAARGLVSQAEEGREPAGGLHRHEHPRLQHRPGPEPVLERAQARNGGRRPPAGGTQDRDDGLHDRPHGSGLYAPPKDKTKYAIVTGTWMGNSDNSAPPEGVVALESAATLWQEYMNETTKALPIADFIRAGRHRRGERSTRTAG